MRFDQAGFLLVSEMLLIFVLNLVTVHGQTSATECNPQHFAKKYKMEVLTSDTNAIVNRYSGTVKTNLFNPPNVENIYTTYFADGSSGVFFKNANDKQAFLSSNAPTTEVLFPADTPLIDWSKTFIDTVNAKTIIVTPSKVYELSNTYTTITESAEVTACSPNDFERCLYDAVEGKAKKVPEHWKYSYCDYHIQIPTGTDKFIVSNGLDEICLALRSEYPSVSFVLPPKSGTTLTPGIDCVLNLGKRPDTTVKPTKPSMRFTRAQTKGSQLDTFTAAPLECQGFGPFDGWIPCAFVYVLLVLFLGAGAGMVVIERKGRHRKAAYLRMQKLLKKNEEPSGVTQTEGTQFDGGDLKSGQKSK